MTDDLQRGNEQIQTENDQTPESSSVESSTGRGDAQVAVGQADAPLVVARPAPGQTVVLDPAPNQTVILNFDPASAQVQVDEGNLVLGFDDDGDGSVDSRIVFLDLAAQDGETATFQIGGAEIDSSLLVSQALALAGQQEAPLEEVAAGPGATSGGASAYDDNLGSILDLLIAQGVIPPTALQFSLIDLEDDPVAFDEADGVIGLTFETITEGGEGAVGTFEGGFEDWQPNQDDCDTPTFPMQVIINFTPDDNEELVSLTLSGIPAGAVLFVGGTDPANIVDTSGGTSPLLTPADLASGLFLLPPEDSGDDIPLTVTATISDPDSGDTSVISGSATAIIDSAADNPIAIFDGAEGCESDAYGASDDQIEAFLGLEGGAIDGVVYGDATDGTAIKTTLELEAGDHVEMTFNFLDAENGGPGEFFNDFAFVTINGEVFPIASVSDANEDTFAIYLGEDFILTWSEESGYFTFSGTADFSGTYEIGVGVMNLNDNAVDSALLVDDLIVTRGEEVIFQDDFTSFDNWDVVGGGFVAIVGDVNTNEDMPGAPTQGLLVASGPFDTAGCGCEIITSYLAYNEDNAGQPGGEEPYPGPVSLQQVDDSQGGGDYGDDCPVDQEPIFGAGFVAAVTDIDGSESLTKIVISTYAEAEPGGVDPYGLEAPLSDVDDPTATNFMVGDQVLVNGETVEVAATFADGSTGLATATIEIVDGVMTLVFDAADRVQSIDLSGNSDTPFQVRLPQHSDDDFQLNLEVTATEFDIDGELTLDNNEATHQAVLNVEVQAVADGAGLNVEGASADFVEDGQIDPALHGEGSGESNLIIPLDMLQAGLIDQDGSEAITQLKIDLQGADAGAMFVDAGGDPLGDELEVPVEGGTVIAQVQVFGDCLILTFDGEDTVGLDIDISGLIGVKLPIDDSNDFTVGFKATTTEVRPEGDVSCESKTTETSYDVHVGGVAGPAAITFGSYDNFPGCDEPQVDGNTLTLSLFEDGESAVEDQGGEGGDAGPQIVPIFFSAATQDSDGSEKITRVEINLDGAPEGTIFVSGGLLLEANDEVAGGTVSFDGDTLVLTFVEPGLDSVDLSAIGVEVPQHSDDDFSIQIKTTTTEYDDDGVDPAVATYETDATINVKIDAVADPVTVSIDAVSSNGGDEAFAPGEAGTVTVDATFSDFEDGSEVHTVTVEIPEGFTVTDLAGGTQDGDTVSWTVTGGSFQAVLGVQANEGLTEDETVIWEAEAKAVEQNENTGGGEGDAECTTENNVATATAEDDVTLDPALPPEVSVSLQGEPLCIKEDGEGEFTVTVTAQGDDFVSEILVENLPGAADGWTTSVVGNDGGSFNPVTGIYTTSGQPGAVILTVSLTPPADSDLDVETEMGADISFTATAEDPDSGDTADAAPVTADVDVDAVADVVTVDIDAVSTSGDEAFAPGETGTVTVDATFGDSTDGSEVHTVTVTVPAGFTVTDLDGGTLNGAEISWTTTDPNFQAVLQVEADDPLPGEQPADWQAEAKAVEQNTNTDPAQGDVECTTDDNEESDQASDRVTLDPALPPEVSVSLQGEPLCIKEDGEGEFTVTVTAQGDDFVSEILVENLPGAADGWTTSVVGNDGGSFNPVTGIYTTSGQPGAVILTVSLTPPADSDLDVETEMGADISFTATAEDPDSGDTADAAPVTADVDVDAVADVVTVDIDAVSTSGDEAFAPGETGTVTVDATFGDSTDGSEVHTVTVTVPAGFTVTDLDGGTLNGAEISWTTTDPNFQAVLQVEADDPLPGEQPADWQAEAKAVEQNTNTDPAQGDVECTTDDNEESDQASDRVTLDPALPPSIDVDLEGNEACIKEDGSLEFDITVSAEAGSDDVLDEVTFGQFQALESAGWTVDVDDNGAGGSFAPDFTYTPDGTDQSVVFTVTLTPPADSDADVFNELAADLSVSATVADPDSGDTASSGPVTIDVNVDAVVDGSEVTQTAAASGNEDTEIDLNLAIALGGDSTTGPGESQGGTDTDGSESVTEVVVTLSTGELGWTLAGTIGAPVENPAGTWTFDTAGESLADVQSLVDSLTVTPPAGFDGTVDVTVVTTTAEAATEAGPNGGSGVECDDDDNVDVDTYTFEVTVDPTVTPPTVDVDLEGNEACIKEDGSVEFDVTVTSQDDDVIDEVTFSQFKALADAGWTVNIVDNSAGGSFDANFTYTADGADQSVIFTVTLTPPADSDVDVLGTLVSDLSVSATAKDGVLVSTPSTPVVIDVNVDAVVDGSEMTQTAAATGDEDTEIDLNLAIALGGDSTTGVGDLDQPANQGGTDTDGSESVTEVVVTLSTGELGWTLAGTIGAPVENPAGTWTFDTAGESLADVQSLVDSLTVTPPAGFDGTVDVTVVTTTAEAATEAGPNGGSGVECDDDDNVDVDTYTFEVTVDPTVTPPTVDVDLEGNEACIKEDGSVEFDVTVTSQDDDVIDEVTFSQFKALADAGWTVNIVDNSAGGSFDANFTYTADGVDQAVTFTVTLTPPADSDEDVFTELGSDLSVSATAKDGVLVSAPSTPVVIDIDVDAVADGESDGLSVSIEVNDGADADTEFNAGETGTVKVSATFGDYTDGSETHTVLVDIPDDFSVVLPLPATPPGVSASVNLDGDVEFTVADGTSGFTDYIFEVTASGAITDPDTYIFSATAKAVEENTNTDPNAGDVECDDGDNEAISVAFDDADVQPIESLLGKIVINEVGLGVSKEQTVDFSGPNDFHVDAGLNYIEIRNIANNAAGVNGQAIEQLDIEIVGPDGTVVTIDLSTLSGSVGSHGLAAKEYLVLYEDGTWAIYDAGGDVKNSSSFGTYTANSPWGFGDNTSDELAVNLMQEVTTGTFVHVDGLLANGAETGGLSHTANDIWDSAFDGSTAAAALLGDVVNNQQFNGLIGDQWALLNAILDSGQSVLLDAEALNEAVNDGVDDATKVFSRVYSDNVPGQAHIPGDTVNGGDPDIDTNQELDWTTSNQSTQGAINQAADDFNPQDNSGDMDPAQGVGTNDEVAGQTVIDVSEGGEADTVNEADDNLLEGGRGQDFLFGDNDANTLLGGDHNDFLFGDQGDDRLEGEKGADLLVDVDGEDVLIGGAGDDVLIGGEERLDGDVAVSDASGDLLVGDNIIEGEVPTFNVVYVMDVSGSMGWDFAGNEPGDPGFTPPTRLDLAKDAFLTLNQQIIDAGFAGVVNIKVVPFSSSGTDLNTLEFTRADDPNLASQINALTAGGGTQYESPLQIAADWLTEDIGGGTERHEGSENFIFFLSDGGDNDGYSPSAGLQADLYAGGITNLTIEAFGFGAPGGTDFVPDELDMVETGTTGPTTGADYATIVDNVDDIQTIFSGISLTDENFGEDVILGGSGNDMIFGDTLVVDPDFVGSDAAYAQMVFNDVEGPALRLPLDTIGLSDWIEGGAGNDSVMGQAGDDTITGQEGDDVIYGGDGDDLVVHTLSEETTGAAGNHYDGGHGTDKLVLNLTAAEAANATIAQAVQDLAAFIGANSDPSSISGSGALGAFTTLGLEVRNFEDLEVLVDGVPISPNADAFTLVTNQSTPFDVDESYIAHFGDDGIGGPVSLNSVSGSASYSAPDVTVNGNFSYVVENDNADLSAPGAVTLVDDSDDNTLTGTAGRDLIIGEANTPADNVTITGAVTAGSTLNTGDDQFSFTLSTAVAGLSITQIVIDLGDAGNFDISGSFSNDFTVGGGSTVGGVSSAVTDGDSTLTITIPAGNFADGDTLTFGIDTDDGTAEFDNGGNFGDEGIPVTITLSDGTVLNGNYADDGSASSLTITGVADSTTGLLLEGLGGDDVLLGSDEADTLDGGAGDDLLNGGAGDDVLTGGADADTFAFSYGGSFEEDTVTDFSLGEDDVLDLSDLLGGGLSSDPDGAELDAYLNISTSGGDTIIDVETDGFGSFDDFRIVLEGVSLDANNSISDEDVINALLNSGNLVV
ncbi:type I secretion C-terminal target domain-containing protein [Pelagibius marinus]|uniref:type I secretion C-terminal target domain-containing protein n=1 Tax=Pelagibius marinus TaxID=2762760 RepID=UPI001872F083|nr:type I secretion C-terminal target domain-containing protein [Pelagibius marinus]